MQVQTICFFVNDPLMLPCVIDGFKDALAQIGGPEAQAVGVGHFELGEPLIARLRPPTTDRLDRTLTRLLGNAALAAAVARTDPPVHERDIPPYRYRNWLFAMGGRVASLDLQGDVDLAIPTYIRRNIRGSTLPETLFHQYLAFLHRQGLLAGERWDLGPLRRALQAALSQGAIFDTAGALDNSLLVTDGCILLGAALERPVYVHELNGLKGCLHCGRNVDGEPVDHDHVRGVVVLDTESLPSESWSTVGPHRLFQVDANLEFDTFSL